MAETGFIIHGAAVCLPEGMRETTVSVADGKFTAIGEDAVRGRVVDATGMVLLPGAIDAHVHYNEPGRTEWEGWATGSLASASGGATSVFEMPLNASPPTLDAESFRLKLQAAEASSVLDFALWGGLTPVNLDKMEELAECGVIGFKAFMSSSGMEDFPRAGLAALRSGMTVAARCGLPVAVHAEDEAMVAKLASEAQAAGRVGMRDYLHSRPVAAEVAAIREVCELAGETGCRLHIVHVSSGEGLAEAHRHRLMGVDVTVETCPHYLLFDEEAAVAIGAAAKCAPPLRPEAIRADLLARVRADEVDTIGTDHSPCPPEMREGENCFDQWGGIMGAGQFLPALAACGLPPVEMARLTAGNVAKRFGLAGAKGSVEAGKDADFILLDSRREWICSREELLTRHAVSPYVGRKFPAVVHGAWLRGERVWSAGEECGRTRGRLLRPTR